MLPGQVKQRDGRLTPFDGDDISRELFAAAGRLGSADAFLIRELTDGVLHFLEQEDLGETASAERIDDIVIKVLTQFGQADLARAFRDRPPRSVPAAESLTVACQSTDAPDVVAGRAVAAFARKFVFAPDIAAAHEQGLIRLGGLESPHRLDAMVVEAVAADSPDPFDDAWSLVERHAPLVGRELIIDSPDWALVDAERLIRFLHGLRRAATAHGRHAIVHANISEPPASARSLVDGPLFPDRRRDASATSLETLSAAGLDVVWHVRASEPVSFAPAPAWSVHFDRSSPIAFSGGLTRRRPAIMLDVGLHLPLLLNRPDVACQAERFLEKLPSLSRLAVAAGGQKRDYLRRLGAEVQREFLLERAALRLTPLGLGEVLQQLLGVRSPVSKPSRLLTRRILEAMAAPLDVERRRTGLDLVLAGPPEPIACASESLHERLGEWDEALASLEPACRGVRIEVDGEIDAEGLVRFVAEKTSLVEMSGRLRRERHKGKDSLVP